LKNRNKPIDLIQEFIDVKEEKQNKILPISSEMILQNVT